MLEIRGLCKSYGGRQVLSPIRFLLPPGQCLGLAGHNGSGKSTLLRLLYDPASVEPYAEWSGEIVNQGLRKGFLAQELSPDELALPVWAFCQGVPAFEGADPKPLDRAARQVGLERVNSVEFYPPMEIL